MSEENNEEITEKIKIIATDDEKIKSFGELLTNDSSRAILQLLFNEELTALQIAERTGISLQLVKYHIIKLQDLGVVKVTKVEKNSKSQDMKFYSASKFSMVIVPPKYSEKTKESKLLVRSFKHIYKVAGLGIAAGISGLLSVPLLEQDRVVSVAPSQQNQISELQDSDESFQSAMKEVQPEAELTVESSDSVAASAPESAPEPTPEPSAGSSYTLEEALELQQRGFQPQSDAAPSFFDSGDLAISLIILAGIFGGLAVFYFIKSLRDSKQKQII